MFPSLRVFEEIVHSCHLDQVEDLYRDCLSKYQIAGQYTGGDKRILDLGVNEGYRAAALLCALPDAEYSGVKYVGARDDEPLTVVEVILAKLCPNSNVRLHNLEINEDLAEKLPGPHGIVHVSGLHFNPGLWQALTTASQVVGKHGLIIIDGYLDGNVRQIVDRFVKSHADFISDGYLQDSSRGNFVVTAR